MSVSVNDPFLEKVFEHESDFNRRKTKILQVNVGKLCNLTCVHCHVEAGPTKTKENMDRQTAEAVVAFLDRYNVETLDLTGGSPEMNPHFEYLVTEARKRDVQVIDRCNLAIIYEEGFESRADFLADNQVDIVASLPCYQKENVDKQRGRGTFDDSIRALLKLNELGYGKEETGLKLNLVYNPVGPHLPPAQAGLEADYKARLKEDFGIVFNQLYTITNMAITRYAKYLKAIQAYDDYVALLRQSFNLEKLDHVMCRETISVGWDGRVFDCDFNQQLNFQMVKKKKLTLFDLLELGDLEGHPIISGEHCFGCTAGAGSSCQGALN